MCIEITGRGASGKGAEGGGGKKKLRFRSWFRGRCLQGFPAGRIGRGRHATKIVVVETAPVLVEGTSGVLDRCPDVQHFAHGLTLAG